MGCYYFSKIRKVMY